MTDRDRAAWARARARWLIPFFGLFLIGGLVLGNLLAVAAGAAGLAWVAVAMSRA